MIRAIARLVEFYKHESCGQCTPCREGRELHLTHLNYSCLINNTDALQFLLAVMVFLPTDLFKLCFRTSHIIVGGGGKHDRSFTVVKRKETIKLEKVKLSKF